MGSPALKKKVDYGTIFDRKSKRLKKFRELSTKPKKCLEFVSNFETFLGFLETYETPIYVSFCTRNLFRFYETLKFRNVPFFQCGSYCYYETQAKSSDEI